MARGKSIHVDAATHDRLKQRGVFGESFCDVIKRMLDQMDLLDEMHGEFTWDDKGNLVSFVVNEEAGGTA